MDVSKLAEDTPDTTLDKGVEILSTTENVQEFFDKVKQQHDETPDLTAAAKSTIDIADDVPPLTMAQIVKVIKHIRSVADINANVQRQARILEIKAKPDFKEKAGKFLLDMAGVQPYQIEVKSGFCRMVFRLPTSTIMQDVMQQSARDIMIGRCMSYDDSIASMYKLAASLVELEIKPPGSAVPIVSYYAMDQMTIEESTAEGCDPGDFLPRRKYMILRNKYLKSSNLFSIVSAAFGKFEQDIADLQLLATEEPDFFQDESI